MADSTRPSIAARSSSDSEVERELRQAIGMLRAAHRLLFRALGAQVIQQRWQPGEPLGERLRRIHSATDEVLRALEALERLNEADSGAPARRPGGEGD